jgi:hypothetical protein
VKATAAIEELTEALKNPSESAKPFLDTGNKLNEASDDLFNVDDESPPLNEPDLT